MMHPIMVQATEQSVQITFDKALVPMDFLMALLDKLQVEYQAQDLRTTPLYPRASGGKRPCVLLRTSPRSRGD